MNLDEFNTKIKSLSAFTRENILFEAAVCDIEMKEVKDSSTIDKIGYHPGREVMRVLLHVSYLSVASGTSTTSFLMRCSRLNRDWLSVSPRRVPGMTVGGPSSPYTCKQAESAMR